MVESVDASHKRVTFLWRGASRNVFILGSPAGITIRCFVSVILTSGFVATSYLPIP